MLLLKSDKSMSERVILDYLEALRKQPPHPAFPRKSFAEQYREQGVVPLSREELEALVSGAPAGSDAVPAESEPVETSR